MMHFLRNIWSVDETAMEREMFYDGCSLFSLLQSSPIPSIIIIIIIRSQLCIYTSQRCEIHLVERKLNRNQPLRSVGEAISRADRWVPCQIFTNGTWTFEILSTFPIGELEAPALFPLYNIWVVKSVVCQLVKQEEISQRHRVLQASGTTPRNRLSNCQEKSPD